MDNKKDNQYYIKKIVTDLGVVYDTVKNDIPELLRMLNEIVNNLFGPDVRASLPINSAIILVILSVVLSFIAGLIPSKQASEKDPVDALRTE